MIVNLWTPWLSVLDKKNENTLKNNKLKNTNIKMSSKGGPVFTFGFPGGAPRPLSPVSYATGYKTASIVESSKLT